MNPSSPTGGSGAGPGGSVSSTKTLLGAGAVLAALLIVLVPIFVTAHHTGRLDACLGNLEKDVAAMAMYASQNDDRLPIAAGWMDAVQPLLDSADRLRCPAYVDEHPGGYGYAMAKSLSQASHSGIETPDETVLIFDSDLPERNAFEDFDAAKMPKRHGKGGNVAYASGRSKRVTGQP